MTHARKSSLLLLAVAFFSSLSLAQTASPSAAATPSSAGSATNYDDVLAYIHTTWDTLTRNMQDCSTIVDPKVPGMVENFFFEVEHYGAVLNANRSYYLTRSQPPFLTTMISDVWQADRQRGRADVKWLERAYQAAVKDHELWMRDPHLAGTTGLA